MSDDEKELIEIIRSSGREDAILVASEIIISCLKQHGSGSDKVSSDRQEHNETTQ